MEKVDRNDPGYSSKLKFLIFTFVFKGLQCFYMSMRQVEWTASRARKNKNMQSEASCSMHMLDTNVRCFHNDMRMLRHRMRGLPCWGFYNAITNSETSIRLNLRLNLATLNSNMRHIQRVSAAHSFINGIINYPHCLTAR